MKQSTLVRVERQSVINVCDWYISINIIFTGRLLYLQISSQIKLDHIFCVNIDILTDKSVLLEQIG